MSEDRTLHNEHYDNLKSYLKESSFKDTILKNFRYFIEIFFSQKFFCFELHYIK
jgi:hypothetical protein